jgi:hypothetical protein
MTVNRQSIFTSFLDLLHVRHTKVFSGQCYVPVVFACLLLPPIFALNYVYGNLGLSIFLILDLFGSCIGYLPFKKYVCVHLNHTVYKVIFKPVFCFHNNLRLAFLGKNNLE